MVLAHCFANQPVGWYNRAAVRDETMKRDNLVLAEDVMPLGHLLLRSERRAPDREALIFPDVRLTYRELADRAWTVARSLVAMGVERGDHVGILMTNHPDIVSTFFGISLAGAVAVPINARYRTTELDSIVEDADLVALLTHDFADAHVDFTALLHEALPGLAEASDPLQLALERHPKLRAVVMMGRKEPTGLLSRAAFDRLGDEAHEAALRSRVEGLRVRDIAIILYTSGTTSAPRGALLTHEAFVRGWMGTGRIFDTTSEDRHWNGLPLFHVAALGCLTWIIGHSATFISDYSWDAGRCLEAIERERVTQFYPAYQPIMEAFLSHPRFPQADLGSLRTFLNTAPPEMLAAFQERLPHAVGMTMYGGTEGGVVTATYVDDPLEDRLNTSGRPQPGIEVRVVGDGRQGARPGRAAASSSSGASTRWRPTTSRPRRRRSRYCRAGGSRCPTSARWTRRASSCSWGARRRRSRSEARTSRRRKSRHSCARTRPSSWRRSSACPTSGCSRCRPPTWSCTTTRPPRRTS